MRMPAKGYLRLGRFLMKVEVLSRLRGAEEDWLVRLPVTKRLLPVRGEIEFSDWDDWLLACPEYAEDQNDR